MDNIYNQMMNNTPPVKELWAKERSKYRLWIILFCVTLVVIISLCVVSIALSITNIDQIAKDIQNADTSTNKITYENARILVWRDLIGLPIAQVGLFLVALFLWSKTTLISYQTKSFAKLSTFAIVIIEFWGFIALMNVIILLFNINTYLASSYQIFKTIIQFVTVIAIYFAWKVGSIKKQFQISERVEMLRNDPNLSQMANNINLNNPFFSNPNSFAQPKNPSQSNSNQQNSNAFGPATQQPLNKQQQAERDLESLSIEQLQSIAQKLSVSGWERMKKEELLETLKRITKDTN